MAFVWARWAPDYVGTDGQGGGRQIPRARCAWMCFHVSRKCLTLSPLLTSKIGCQRHFLECPVKINMWTETTGLQSPEWWARGPSWHLCPTTPFASYANAKLYKIKGLIYLRLLRRLRRRKYCNISLWVLYVCRRSEKWFSLFNTIANLMLWASVSLCARNHHLPYFSRW